MKNQSQKTRRKVLKIIGLGFAGLILLSMVVILILGSTPPSIPLTPSGVKQFQAVYIPMQDGTQIAVRISLPPDLGNDQRIPAVIETTRYLTDIKSTFLLNTALKLSGDTKINLRVGHALMEAGYAYIRVDARGSGASFGRREMELSQEEIADMGEIIDWVVQQPWSNGKVGTYGISYSGNTAELAAALNHPNLKAVAPLYSDFDHLTGNLMPGGILNTFLTENWSAMVATMDANAEEGLFHGGIAPVDEDEDEMLLTDALAERDNIDIAERLHTVTYFDDLLTPDYTAHSIAPLYYKESIQQSGLPFYVRVGWLDAGTVDGAISRYLTFSNPQQLWIGPWNHSGTHFYDPFIENQTTETPMIIQQDLEVVAFFDRYLKDESNDQIGHEIHYYMMGAGTWHTSATWPIEGFTSTPLYFHPDGSLQKNLPADDAGTNKYIVDFSATTGESNRWYTQLGGPPISYPDRATEDQKLLTYTSAPLETAIEITGNPVATINLASTASDGAIYVYLETVTPEGEVIYLTEGQLRTLHRQETDRDLGHVILGPRHSYEQVDGLELTPGENVELNIGLYATSVLIPQGYRLRIAIAGHDASTFERIPVEGEPVIELHTNGETPSYISIPIRVVTD